MANQNNANFGIRALATLIDWSLIWTIYLLIIWQTSGSTSLAGVVTGALWLIAIFLLLSSGLYSIIMVNLCQGTIGKLITGLRVVNYEDGKLNLKRNIFRHTIGYMFSSSIFWLGFLNVITDPQKLAWHDKVTESKVVVRQTLWPMALVGLVVLLLINGFLTFAATNTAINNNSVKNEVMAIGSSYYMSQPQQTEYFSETVRPEFLEEANNLINDVNNQENLTAAEEAEANAQAEQLLQLAENDSEKSIANTVLATIKVKVGNLPAAVSYLDEARSLDSENLLLLYQSFTVAMSFEEYESAYEYAQEMVERLPDKANSYASLAISAYALGKNEEALVAVQKAQELDPNNPAYTELLTNITAN